MTITSVWFNQVTISKIQTIKVDFTLTSSSLSEIEEKPEMSEDSYSEVEVPMLYKTGHEVNHNLNSNSASTKGGM